MAEGGLSATERAALSSVLDGSSKKDMAIGKLKSAWTNQDLRARDRSYQRTHHLQGRQPAQRGVHVKDDEAEDAVPSDIGAVEDEEVAPEEGQEELTSRHGWSTRTCPPA